MTRKEAERPHNLSWRIAFHTDEDNQITPYYDVVSDDTGDVIVSGVTQEIAELIIDLANAQLPKGAQ